MEYSVYLITAPNGHVYVGLTSGTVKKRWHSHVARARKEGRNHPLYNTINKYGPDSFLVESIASGLSKTEAQSAETTEIRKLREEWPAVMNISDGGETDGAVGGRKFWKDLNEDPKRRGEYLAALSNTKLERDWSDYDAMAEAARQWRSDNPRIAYKMAHRGARLAHKARGVVIKGHENTGPVKVSKKAARLRRSRKAKVRAFQQWALRTEKEVQDLGRKISRGVSAYFENPEAKARVSTQLVEARARIDRDKQGKAASAGLKSFWVELRKDPQKYQEYIARRKASLMKTLGKKNAN